MDYPGKVITKNQVTPTQTSATGVWTLDDAAAATRNNNWPVAGVPNPISKSLRFNPADTAYLSRTFGTPTNNKKWTMSGWMKRSAINDGNYNTLFSRYVDGNNFMRVDLLGDNLRMYQYKSANDVLLRSTLVLRDPSAWYHFVVVYDSDNATSSNRVLFYINNTQITSFSSSTYPSSGSSSIWNTSGGATHQIGTFNANGAGEAFSGYMTEMNFIDGQALTPSSFGMTDPITGVWEPLKYSGTYGTNGFYLNFKDATSTTTLGLDYSGNSNTWTTNNFSVTAGAGNDSLTDVPTPWIVYNTTGDVGGVVRGNYSTLNPINKGAGVVLTNGSLDYTNNATYRAVVGTIAVSTGKYYWEVNVSTNSWDIGVCEAASKVIDQSTSPSLCLFGYSCFNGNKYIGPSKTASPYDTSGGISGATVLGFAVDFTTGTATIYRDNVSKGVITTWTPGVDYVPYIGYDTTPSGIASFNFGQRPFAYTPPSGFLSLCTTNLPASTILKGSEYMNAVIYAGSASQQTIDSNLSILDFAWIKNRTAARDHIVVDTVRGGSPMLTLYPSFTYPDDNSSPNYNPTSISGSSIVLGGAKLGINNSGENFVLWGWNAGGSTVTNTSGTISAQVRASTTSGFSIVTYTGTGVNATVGHGLGVAPSMIIVKNRVAPSGYNWNVYHASIGNTQRLFLDSTSGQTSGVWNNTSPTSTVFTIAGAAVYNNGDAYVAYCFAPISGFSAFGSYTGNGSGGAAGTGDGPFIYLGFRPRWIMVKVISGTTANWSIIDTARSPYNFANLELWPSSSAAEQTYAIADILSNGFKLRSDSGQWNSNGAVYIYAAFAENPFKNALAR